MNEFQCDVNKLCSSIEGLVGKIVNADVERGDRSEVKDASDSSQAASRKNVENSSHFSYKPY